MQQFLQKSGHRGAVVLAAFVMMLCSFGLTSTARAAEATPVSSSLVATAYTPTLAQYSNSDDGDSSYSERRRNRGYVKLAIFGAILLFSGVGWVIKKIGGE